MFEREEVLGRDATSVFPTETKAKPLDGDAVNAMLGSNLRFITESEVPDALLLRHLHFSASLRLHQPVLQSSNSAPEWIVKQTMAIHPTAAGEDQSGARRARGGRRHRARQAARGGAARGQGGQGGGISSSLEVHEDW